MASDTQIAWADHARKPPIGTLMDAHRALLHIPTATETVPAAITVGTVNGRATQTWEHAPLRAAVEYGRTEALSVLAGVLGGAA